MNISELLVTAIVAAAGVFLAVRMYRNFKHGKPSCSGGCSGTKSRSSRLKHKQIIPLEELSASAGDTNENVDT